MSLHRYSAERFVNRDDTGEDTRLGVCHRILCLELCALRVEQGEEVDNPFAISHAGDRGGACAFARLVRQLHEALLLLTVVDECVLGLLERPQDDLLELGERLPSYALRTSKTRALPRSKAAQLNAGVTAYARLSETLKRLPRPASSPRNPVTVMCGYRSAAAAASRAVDAARRRSADRTSGRWRSSVSGSPMAIALASAGARPRR